MSNQNPYYPDNQQWQSQQQHPYGGEQYPPPQPQTVYGSYSDPAQQSTPYPPPPQPYSQGQNYGYGPQGPYAAYPGAGPATQPNQGGGLAIAGLVLGIVSLILFWVFYLGIPAAIAGIVLSALGRRSVQRRTMATVGLVLSIIAIVLSLCFIGLIVIGLTHSRGY